MTGLLLVDRSVQLSLALNRPKITSSFISLNIILDDSIAPDLAFDFDSIQIDLIRTSLIGLELNLV